MFNVKKLYKKEFDKNQNVLKHIVCCVILIITCMIMNHMKYKYYTTHAHYNK